MITLALTHYNRFDLLCEAIALVENDRRISEIVISDDASDDGSWEQLLDKFSGDSRVKLFRNGMNLDCYGNKAAAVRHATREWVILFDSDNVLWMKYLDALSWLHPWKRERAYLPVFAAPEFDYRKFSGITVTRHNVSEYMDDDTFKTALNTANFFFHRDEYLRVWDANAQPYTADSIYQNFRWLAGGNELYFVPGMEYFHRLHDGSHFVLNDHKTGEFARKTETLLKMLR